MILVFGLLASALGTVGFLSLHLSRAPIGFEAKDGFHLADSGETPVKQAPLSAPDFIMLGEALASRR